MSANVTTKGGNSARELTEAEQDTWVSHHIIHLSGAIRGPKPDVLQAVLKNSRKEGRRICLAHLEALRDPAVLASLGPESRIGDAAGDGDPIVRDTLARLVALRRKEGGLRAGIVH